MRYNFRDFELIDSVRVSVPESMNLRVRSVRKIKDKYYVVGFLQRNSPKMWQPSIHVYDVKSMRLEKWLTYNRLGKGRNQIVTITSSREHLYISEDYSDVFFGAPDSTYGSLLTRFGGDPVREEIVQSDYSERFYGSPTFTATLDSGLLFVATKDITDTSRFSTNHSSIQRTNYGADSLYWMTPLPFNYHLHRKYSPFRVLVMPNGDFLVGGVAHESREGQGYLSGTYIWLTRISSQGKPRWTRLYPHPWPDSANRRLPSRSTLLNELELKGDSIVAHGYARGIYPDSRPFYKMFSFQTDGNGCIPGMPCEDIIDLTNPDRTPSSINSPDYEWRVFRETPNGDNGMVRYRMAKVDTIMEANDYLNVLVAYDSLDYEPDIRTPIYLREQLRKIFWFRPGYNHVIYDEKDDIQLYDWAARAGDRFSYPDYPGYGPDSTYLYVVAVDTVVLSNGDSRTRQAISRTPDPAGVFDYWIEGIGSARHGLLGAIQIVYGGDTSATDFLTCYGQYGQTLLQSTDPDRGCWRRDRTIPTRPGPATVAELPVDVFPNPTSGLLQLRAPFRPAALAVYDATGRRRAHQPTGGNELDLGALPAGIYLLQIMHPDGRSAVRRVVKQ